MPRALWRLWVGCEGQKRDKTGDGWKREWSILSVKTEACTYPVVGLGARCLLAWCTRKDTFGRVGKGWMQGDDDAELVRGRLREGGGVLRTACGR